MLRFYEDMFALRGWKAEEINGIRFELNSIVVENGRGNHTVLSSKDKEEQMTYGSYGKENIPTGVSLPMISNPI